MADINTINFNDDIALKKVNLYSNINRHSSMEDVQNLPINNNHINLMKNLEESRYENIYHPNHINENLAKTKKVRTHSLSSNTIPEILPSI